jgi:hypothetical protein
VKQPIPFAVAVLLAGCLWVSSLAASEPVKVRGGIHEGYIRLVFNFPVEPVYQAALSDGRLELGFDAPASYDFRHLMRQLEGLVGQPELGDEGRRVSIAYLGGRELSHFQIGRKVVIDLRGDNQAILRTIRRAARAEARQAAEQQAVAREGPEPAPATPAPATPAPAAAVATPPAGETLAVASEVVVEAPGDEPDAGVEVAVPEVVAEAPGDEPDAGVEVAAPEVVAEAPRDEPDVGVEVVVPEAAATFSLTVANPEAEVAARPVPGGLAPWPRPLVLRLAWPSPVRAAAIKRGRRIVLAFDGEAPADLVERLRAAAPELEALSAQLLAGATVLSFDVNALVEPRLQRSGGGWTIDLRARAPARQAGIAASRVVEDGKSRLHLAAVDPGPVLLLDEAGIGGRLFVVPLGLAGQAVRDHREFVQFALPRTVQGIAVQAYGEDLEVTADAGGVAIAAPAGLLLGQARPPAASPPPALLGHRAPRLLDLAAWRQGSAKDYDSVHKRLQSALSTAPPARSNLARLDLARFYFAHGKAREALGVLILIGRDLPQWRRDPELLLLEGASRLLAGDYGAAAAHLGHPALADEPEAWPWQALLATAAQDWAFAEARFRAGRELIDAYPRGLRLRLRLAAAETQLALGDPAAAEAALAEARDDIGPAAERSLHDYLAGRVLLAKGLHDPGYAMLREVAEGRSRAVAARARLALIDRDRADGLLSEAAATAALEELLLAWRGDPFEVALLTRLAELYLNQGRYREALGALRRAGTRFPDPRFAASTQARMVALVEEIFRAGRWRDLAATEAFSLYREFRELAPEGSAGDRLIVDLVDRLVAAEAYGQAAEVLRLELAERSGGRQRAQFGARLALLELLLRQPQASLQALEASTWHDLSAGVARTRRHLRAKALSETNRAGEALALLASDVSRNARRLRLEIHWRQENWGFAAAALDLLVEPPPGPGEVLSDEAGALVLDLAVARTLAGDVSGLAALAEGYRPAMARAPQGADFLRLVEAQDAQAAGMIATTLAEGGQPGAFLGEYRARLERWRLSDLI